MRRISLWLVATVVVVVLLFSYKTSLNSTNSTRPGANAPGIVSGQPIAAGGPPTGQAAPAGQSVPGASGAPGASASPTRPTETVVNGKVAKTIWGPVQVQVTISTGKITDVIALQVPDGTSMDQNINSYAVPRLRQEVLTAQSGRIDAITGATITSDGYAQSLQAALDSAHFQR
ncbi:FMN-binding protein [Rugosimonospora acidiphila]|uniref:FMN-binding protein n=1 Tax=Rugosimonospora acidiphila TaxID=556531 RepID=A0ABP9RWU2_9ACTN